MAAKEISVKKYVVPLSGEERERLETLIRKGKSPARRVLKARILLKADVSEAGKGWSDNRIIEALETSPSMVYRVRKQLVEKGFEAVLSRKPRAMPAVARIFDGEKEAKLIALACSKPPILRFTDAAHHRSCGEAFLRARPVRRAAAALRQVGADEARRHGVHGDAVLAQLQGKAPRENHHRCRVECIAGQRGADPRDRGYIDDP